MVKFVFRLLWQYWKIERMAMIWNRYNYPTLPISDIKGKETQTQNNWTLMETSLAESQTDSYFPKKWPNGYPKQKDVSDTHIQRRTITKINHDRITALKRSVNSISLGRGVGGGSLNRFYVATIFAPYLLEDSCMAFANMQASALWPMGLLFFFFLLLFQRKSQSVQEFRQPSSSAVSVL